MWIHRKKPFGVRSGELRGQATGPLRPFQRSLQMAVRCYQTWRAKWPAAPSCWYHTCLAPFLPEKPSKSVHWAVGVTSKAQSKCHVQCPPKRWPQSVVGGCDRMQHEGLLQAKHDCCGCWKSYVREKLDLRIFSWFWRESIRQQQPSGRNVAFLSAHINLCFVGVGCVSISVPVLLNIWSQLVTNYNPFSEHIGGFSWFTALVRPIAMVCGTARTHVRSKVVWSVLSPHEVWAWSFSAFCINDLVTKTSSYGSRIWSSL